MKTSKFYTLGVIIVSILYTGYICILAIWKYFFGTINRTWVNATTQHWVHRILGFSHVEYKVFNPHHVEPKANQPTLVMCNHSSLYDIPLSLLAFPNHSIRMLAKKELSRIP